MAMVGVNSGRMYRQTRSLSHWLGLRVGGRWTGWTHAMALTWWKVH